MILIGLSFSVIFPLQYLTSVLARLNINPIGNFIEQRSFEATRIEAVDALMREMPTSEQIKVQ
jgi:hypothetical protein